MKKLLLILVLFSSCKFSTTFDNRKTDKDAAEKVVDRFYSFLKNQQVDSALNLMHPYLLMSNDPAKLREFLQQTGLQMATIKERKLDHWETKVTEGLERDSDYGLYYIHSFPSNNLKVSIGLKKDFEQQLKIVNLQMDPNEFKKMN